jgi:hypothetical protein
MTNGAQTYDHTQVGTTILLSLLAAAGFVIASLFVTTRSTGGVNALPTAATVAVGATLVILLLTSVVFSRLTVRVGKGEISWRFGLGLLEHRIPLAEVVAATVVTNPIWSGYGVRRLSNGWLYNVAGRRAVELVLRDGRRVRIGSDEPELLLGAITALR